MSSTNSLKCPICYEPYNLTLRLPRNIPTCGHTLCVTCLSELLRFPGNFKCPIDNQIHYFAQKTLETFPTNYALRDIIEERCGSQLCPKHHRELEFVCMNEKVRLCSHCVLFDHSSDRQLHEIKQISDLSGQVTENVEALEEMLKDLDEEKKDARERLASRKAGFMKLLKEKFDELAFLLKAKEKELESGIEAVFKREEERIETIVGGKSDIRKKIANRINGCQDISSAEDPFRLISGNHEDIAEEIHEIDLQVKLDVMEDALEEAYLEFGESLEYAVRHVEELKFQTVDTCKMLDQVYQNSEVFDKDLKLLEKVPIKSEAFSFELNMGLFGRSSGILCIKEKANIGANSGSFNLSQAQDIHAIFFHLTQPQTPKLSSEDLKTLLYVRSVLPRLSSLHIIPTGSIQMSFDTFKEIFSALLWRASCLEIIDFSLIRYIKSIGDQEIKYLSEHLFKKAVNLKSIKLNLGALRLRPGSLRGILQSIVPLADKLEELILNLDQIDVPEDIFCEIMVKMGNIRVFRLSVNETGFGDRALMDLVANVFRWMSKVYWMTLDFCGTRVTGSGIQELLLKLPKRLDGFGLNLQRNILIQDECLEHFVRNKLAKMEQLGYLDIQVEETSVSPQLKQEIQQKKNAIEANRRF